MEHHNSAFDIDSGASGARLHLRGVGKPDRGLLYPNVLLDFAYVHALHNELRDGV